MGCFVVFVKYLEIILASAKNPEKKFQCSFLFFFFLIISWHSALTPGKVWRFGLCLKLAIWKQALKSLRMSQGRIYRCFAPFPGHPHCAVTMPLSRQTVRNTLTLCKTAPLLRVKQCYTQPPADRSHAKRLAWLINSYAVSPHADFLKPSHPCSYSCSVWHTALRHSRLGDTVLGKS